MFIIWADTIKARCVGILGITMMNLDNVNTQDTHWDPREGDILLINPRKRNKRDWPTNFQVFENV